MSPKLKLAVGIAVFVWVVTIVLVHAVYVMSVLEAPEHIREATTILSLMWGAGGLFAFIGVAAVADTERY
jgi:hypothetical protein